MSLEWIDRPVLVHLHRASIDGAIECAPGPGKGPIPSTLHFDEVAPVSLRPLQIGSKDGWTEQRHGHRNALGDHRSEIEPILFYPEHRKRNDQEDAVRAGER